MTKKDRTVIGLIVVVLAILMAVIIKNGGNQLPKPNAAGNLSEPLSPDKFPAAPPVTSRQERESTATAVIAPGNQTPGIAPSMAHKKGLPNGAGREPASLEAASEVASETPATAIELALKFQTALNGLDSDSATASTEDSALLLVALFAELPEDPKAEAELAQELATAYVQSSSDNEKVALIDLLMIIPSDAAMQLGETLSRSSDPEDRQMGLDLLANGGAPDNFGE